MAFAELGIDVAVSIPATRVTTFLTGDPDG